MEENNRPVKQRKVVWKIPPEGINRPFRPHYTSQLFSVNAATACDATLQKPGHNSEAVEGRTKQDYNSGLMEGKL